MLIPLTISLVSISGGMIIWITVSNPGASLSHSIIVGIIVGIVGLGLIIMAKFMEDDINKPSPPDYKPPYSDGEYM